VIRLPREWLGPPEELVPIGPAARARAAQREATDSTSTTADAFWSEDSAALHDAVQAPLDAPCGPLEPPVGLVPPVAGFQLNRLWHRPRLSSIARLAAESRRGILLAAAAVVVVAISVIAINLQPTEHRAATHGESSATAGTASHEPSRVADSAGAAARSTHPQARRHLSIRHHARTRARARRPGKPRDRSAPSHHFAGAPVSTTAHADAPSPITHSTAAAPTTTTPSTATASTASSSGSKSSGAPAGPIGFGSFSGGCQPKCQ
jgi:hypothetical protein